MRSPEWLPPSFSSALWVWPVLSSTSPVGLCCNGRLRPTLSPGRSRSWKPSWTPAWRSGAVLVRVAIAIGGLKAALFAPAVVALLLIAGLWRRIRKIDASATVPQVEIQLLRSISIFAALPAPSLEGIARELEALAVSQGTIVIKEGERGDSYYAVADGELAVSRDRQFLRMVSRGDGFGEIALIRDVPRQATVTATTDASLYMLDREPFVQAVTGHATTISTVGRVIARHLGEDVAE